jgi:hypothetical protein
VSDSTEPVLVPEGMSQDVPFDVDFSAMLARSQAGLIAMGGLSYQANEDLKQKLQMLGKGAYAPVADQQN